MLGIKHIYKVEPCVRSHENHQEILNLLNLHLHAPICILRFTYKSNRIKIINYSQQIIENK